MIKSLNIEELCKLCNGADFWHSHSIEKYNIPAIMMSDGPHGLRTQKAEADHLGIHDSVTAICFPSASSLANSFNRECVYKMGELLGEEARAEGVNIVLGPAINIKRTPLCGRNFEYFSEDPYLSGELAAEAIKGIQSNGVGACVKHYVANNQENGRMVLSANIKERPLREIYLRAFERAIKESPHAVMSSYNKVNGEYVGESKYLLTDILRGEWGFEGIVISDWYAVNDRIKSLLAGLDLEMPGGASDSIGKLLESAKDSNLNKALIESANRIVRTARMLNLEKTDAYSMEEHHNIAVDLACESAVLLKNNGIFPINKSEKILIIGDYAKKPRYQGGGSSHINAYRIESVVDNLDWADFYDGKNDLDSIKERLMSVGKAYDKVIVFVGLPDECESEGYDRIGLELPTTTNSLISLVASCVNRLGVVLFHGSPITMPWLDCVDGLLTMGLCGEGVGKACAKLLVGEINPSGKLAESYPMCIEHTPSYINSRNTRNIDYAEGVFVGYRYYSTKKLPTLFPFGHGLSYTKFEYSDLVVMRQEDTVHISVSIKNCGDFFGKEVIQLYISPPKDIKVDRPVVELRRFDKIALKAGETKTVRFELYKNDFSYFNDERGNWQTDGGIYRLIIGRSAEEEIIGADVNIIGDIVPPIIDENVTIGELLDYAPTSSVIKNLTRGYSDKSQSDAISGTMKQAMLRNAPIRLVKAIAKMDDITYESFLRGLKEM